MEGVEMSQRIHLPQYLSPSKDIPFEYVRNITIQIRSLFEQPVYEYRSNSLLNRMTRTPKRAVIIWAGSSPEVYI